VLWVLAAVVAGVVGLLPVLLQTVVNGQTGATGATEIDVMTLKTGDCLLPFGSLVSRSTVPKINCAEPHHSEVYASNVLSAGFYPGVTEVTAIARRQCVALFDRFVGLAYAKSGLNYHYIYPDFKDWQNGYRVVHCFVYDPSQYVTGSLQGAAR